MDACLHTWAPMYSTCAHMCRTYVARSGRDQRLLVAWPLLPLPLWSTAFSCVLFRDTKVKRKRDGDSYPRGCCLQLEGAVWVRGCLCVWFTAERATVSVNDGVPGFIAHLLLLLLFFLTIKYLFLLLFSLFPWLFGVGSGEGHKGLLAIPS